MKEILQRFKIPIVKKRMVNEEVREYFKVGLYAGSRRFNRDEDRDRFYDREDFKKLFEKK